MVCLLAGRPWAAFRYGKRSRGREYDETEGETRQGEASLAPAGEVVVPEHAEQVEPAEQAE